MLRMRRRHPPLLAEMMASRRRLRPLRGPRHLRLTHRTPPLMRKRFMLTCRRS